MLEAPQTLLLSTGVVTASEIGNKTMLMAICLAARFRRPALIIWGILVATVLNHAMAGGVGAVLATLITPEILRWILIVSFAAMAAWMLVPDKLDDEETDEGRMKRFGVFGTTVVLFFLAEMGDKTQLATVALAAKFPAEALWVISGTTLGMMIADAPAVFIGQQARRAPLYEAHAPDRRRGLRHPRRCRLARLLILPHSPRRHGGRGLKPRKK